jgi:hypothetical protein
MNCSFCDKPILDFNRIMTLKTDKGLRIICDSCVLIEYPKVLRGEYDANANAGRKTT